ncbi:MAG: MFS transporter [Cognatishimia sp.]
MRSEKSKSNILLILLLWAAGLAAAGQFAKVSVTFESLQTIYTDHKTYLGFIVSIIGLTGVVFGLTAAQLVNAFGYRRLLVISMMAGALISLFQASLPGFEWLLVSRILEGFTHLAIVIAAPTLISTLTAPTTRSFFMALWSTFFGITYALMALIAPPLIARFGPESIFIVHAIYMGGVGALVMFALPVGQVKRAKFPSFKQMLSSHRSVYTSAHEFAPGLGWLFYTLTFVSVLTILPSSLPQATALILIPLLPIAGIVSSLTLGAVLLRNMAATTLVQIGFLLSAVSCLALVLGVSGIWGFLCLFAAMGLIQSASFAAIPELNPTEQSQALANGAMAQMGTLGNTLGTPLLLWLVAFAGSTALPIALTAIFLLGALSHYVLAKRRQKK